MPRRAPSGGEATHGEIPWKLVPHIGLGVVSFGTLLGVLSALHGELSGVPLLILATTGAAGSVTTAWAVQKRHAVTAVVGCAAVAAVVVGTAIASPRDRPTRSQGEGSRTGGAVPSATSSSILSVPPVVFRDDFSNSEGGWPQGAAGRASTSYAEGAYLVHLEHETGFTSTLAGIGLLQGDVVVEADSKQLSNVVGRFGLVCRHGPGSDYSFYGGWIDGTGYYQLFRYNAAQDELITLATGRSSHAMGTLTSWFRLRLECVGGTQGPATLRLSVNGQLLAEAQDSVPLAIGSVGLIAGGSGTGGFDAEFDNFSVERRP